MDTHEHQQRSLNSLHNPKAVRCQEDGGESNTQENVKRYSSVLITGSLDSACALRALVLLDIIQLSPLRKGHRRVTAQAESALSFDISGDKEEADTSCLYFSSSNILVDVFSSTWDVDMREVSWRPVRSEEEMFTGAPR